MQLLDVPVAKETIQSADSASHGKYVELKEHVKQKTAQWHTCALLSQDPNSRPSVAAMQNAATTSICYVVNKAAASAASRGGYAGSQLDHDLDRSYFGGSLQ